MRNPGADLEQRLGALLRHAGYDVDTNVILDGRSGARHEIDVLGTKHDGVAALRVAVECKAWGQPAEKDVVAKFAFVLGDLGVREGIIVCLGGFRTGAQMAARELGVTLWDAEELGRRLGHAGIAQVEQRMASTALAAMVPTITVDDARAMVTRHVGRVGRSGRLRRLWRRDETGDMHCAQVWMPAALAELGLSRPDGRHGLLQHTQRMWNTYDLVADEPAGAALLRSDVDRPHIAEQEVTGSVLLPRTKVSAPAASIAKAVARHGAASTDPARERAARRLGELGIPLGYAVRVESCALVHVPVFVAIARHRGGESVAAVDMVRGWLDPHLCATLSRQATWLRDVLAPPHDQGAGTPEP